MQVGALRGQRWRARSADARVCVSVRGVHEPLSGCKLCTRFLVCRWSPRRCASAVVAVLPISSSTPPPLGPVARPGPGVTGAGRGLTGSGLCNFSALLCLFLPLWSILRVCSLLVLSVSPLSLWVLSIGERQRARGRADRGRTVSRFHALRGARVTPLTEGARQAPRLLLLHQTWQFSQVPKRLGRLRQRALGEFPLCGVRRLSSPLHRLWKSRAPLYWCWVSGAAGDSNRSLFCPFCLHLSVKLDKLRYLSPCCGSKTVVSSASCCVQFPLCWVRPQACGRVVSCEVVFPLS